MGGMTFTLSPDNEFWMRQHKNMSGYLNNILDGMKDGDYKDITKMSIRQKAAMLLAHRPDLPPNLVKELLNFMGVVE